MILDLDDLATLYRVFLDQALERGHAPDVARERARLRLRALIGDEVPTFNAVEFRAALDAHPAGKGTA